MGRIFDEYLAHKPSGKSINHKKVEREKNRVEYLRKKTKKERYRPAKMAHLCDQKHQRYQKLRSKVPAAAIYR